MWGRCVARLAVWALKRSDLTLKNRQLLTTAILDELQALPLRAIIEAGEDGTLTIQGKAVDMEKGRQLHESATQALRNSALNLIREQVTHIAFVMGGIKAEKPDDLIFARAALWWSQQEEKYLLLLAQRNEEPDL